MPGALTDAAGAIALAPAKDEPGDFFAASTGDAARRGVAKRSVEACEFGFDVAAARGVAPMAPPGKTNAASHAGQRTFFPAVPAGARSSFAQSGQAAGIF